MKVKISSIVQNQFPAFIRNESPLMVEFIRQYFVSQEYQSAPIDLITNLDEYTKIENLTNLVSSTTLTADISFTDTVIPVTSTEGFADSYGLIQIGSEIITYLSKTDTSFVDCIRGFSGIYNENLEFKTTESDFHDNGDTVENLSILFLQKFLDKLKKKLVPGFDGREFAEDLNTTHFIQSSKSFYTTKGTDQSFEILFGALYGEDVQVIRPRDYLFTPSAAEYRVSKDLVVEALFGDPLLLENRTLFQDTVDGNNLARGSVSKVEEIVRGNKTYYVVSLDYDFNKDIIVSGSVFGEFYIHPKTQLTTAVASGSTTIDVDSTAGFANSGELVINDDVLIEYTSKSTTQFFGCSGITQNLSAGSYASTNDFAYGIVDGNRVLVRVTGVIKDFEEIETAYHLNVGDTIYPKSLGKTSTDIRSKNWLYNLPISYKVQEVTLIESLTSKYRIQTIDDNILVNGDTLKIVYKNGTILNTTVISRVNEYSFIVQGQGVINGSDIDYVERQISKVSSTAFSSVNVVEANVQNVYENSEENFIVASPSLPKYLNQNLEVTNRGVNLTSNVNGNIIFQNDHGFLSGDVVVYNHSSSGNHLGISSGTYYVKKNTSDSFSLASSRANVKAGTYVSFAGNSSLNKISTINYNDFYNKTLQNQKLFRKIDAPVATVDQTETPIGKTGILVNGVEIVNYKSQDAVFYGPVEKIDVISSGNDYDVLNPPVIRITDEFGTGLVADCEVKGSLKEIRIIDRGLNYIAEPSVTITGGNGKDAKARAELGLFEHSAYFNSNAITSNTIGFTTYHGFNNSEKIIYKPDGISQVIGITTDAEYYASRVNGNSIRLHKTLSDSISGINTVNISYNGFAVHRFVSSTAKTKVSTITVTDEGKGYTNRRISIPSSGINTATNTFTRKNHGFKTGEIIIYESFTGTSISGITTNTSYYVTEVNDGFKLSPLAITGISTSQDFFFKTGQFVNITNSGIGTHYFNYEPIQVSLYGISSPIVDGSSGSSGITSSNLTFYIFENPENSNNVRLQARGSLNLPAAQGGAANNPCSANGGIDFAGGGGLCVGSAENTLTYSAIAVANTSNFIDYQPALLLTGSYSSVVSSSTPYVFLSVWPNYPDTPTPAFHISPSYVSGTPIHSWTDFVGNFAALFGFTPTGTLGTWQITGTENYITIQFGSPPTPTPPTPQQETISTFLAQVQPIFRGEITSVSVVNGGQNYGQEDILNYNRQPNIKIESGKDAVVQAIVSNGKITQVLIINPGSGYNSPPEILVSGTGYNAKLTPIINNGEITEVKIVDSGYGYNSKNITLTVVPAGTGAQIRTIPKQWTVNLIERLINTKKITNDDGIISKGINSEYELQYTHGYVPRPLRQSVSAIKFVSGNLVYQPDLQLNSNGLEIASDAHSPIIGWAYDGNPIYGPYGYDEDGDVTFMRSGYEIITQENRPDTTLYPEGFFVEDFVYTGNGDLDEHNGKYCFTPDFPKGTYAYFATISGNSRVTDQNNPFINFFQPSFPYFIGNTYNSKLIDFNFDYRSNQDAIELNKTGWLRNTAPFKLNSSTSSYKYLLEPFDILEQTATVTSTLSGSVEKIDIISGGSNYKIKDKLVFNNTSTGGSNAKAEISLIKGKEVSSISVASTSVYDVEFVADSEYGILGIASQPHGFNNNDLISVKNLNYNQKELQKTFTVGINQNQFTLASNVSVIALTGVTTYFGVYGNLFYSNLSENDILQVDDEKVKVLNIDTQSSRIFVERAYNGTVGSSHTIGAAITEVPRKFFIGNVNQDITNSFKNRELYFNPTESLGIGNGTTITFSNPGVGITNIFVPTRSIYVPNHNLNTGEKLTYKLNDGSNITVSTNGVTTSLLSDNTTVYAVKYSDNFIGLSTQQVGIGSTGNFVGYNTTSAAKILYYNVLGSGAKHSLVTTYPSIIGQVDRNIVSIYPKTESQLLKNDLINVDVRSNSSKTVKIVYNRQTQRLLVNPRTFLAADVNTFKDFITIIGHNYFTGQKVLYSATNPITGLQNNVIYYVVVINNDRISLSSSYYDSTLSTPKIINFASASDGTLYEVNPRIKVTKNNSVIFDLSDSSLSIIEQSQLVPAFDFDLFTDDKFVNEFKTTFTNTSFNVTKVGNIGIDVTAKLTLTYDSNVPNELYYALIPLKSLDVFVDSENDSSHNILNYVDSVYSGQHYVSGIGTTSFSYSIQETPETISYAENVTYTTTSANAQGSIAQISVLSGGSNYKSLPGISSVISLNGSGAIFDVKSETIGRINNVNLNDIGFDYSSDLTLTPLTQTPVVLKVIPQSTIKSIGISSQGVNYNEAPTLVLLDGLTLKQVVDVDLRYNLGDNQINIIKNSKGINNVTPIIIPTNNTNAIGINSISFDSSTELVTAVLSESYSTLEEFPFTVGDKVLVENVVIQPDEDAKGYNSSGYDYARFTITDITPNLGFAGGSITYSLASYLKADETPGVQSQAVTTGSITPEKFFPQFTILLTKNSFLRDEVVTATDASGVVQFWNPDNELLTISTTNEFKIGQVILGSDSLSSGFVDKIYDFKSKYVIDSSSVVRKGWKTEKGFLDNEFQRIQDSNYYQAFAYSLKSKVDYNTWNNAVSSLNHIAGFKKFADLIVESDSASGLASTQADAISDLTIFTDSEVDLNCVYDFDLATENNYLIKNSLGSNEVYFTSQILDDYTLAIGNRVLNIDDISSGFDDTNREFILKSNSLNIFSRTFDGSSSSIVDLNANVLRINNHYFTNGEKVTYSHNGTPISINTVNISGIGNTTLLPSTVYVIKYSESTIGLTDTAEKALKDVPVPFVFSAVGIGSSHTLTATNQNTRALISLGGVVQSPVTSTASTTALSSYVGVGSTVIYFNSIFNFSSGDFAKINSEIMKIVTVGSATTNDVTVNRGWAGTGIGTHNTGATVYKIKGDYNIVDNTLHFVDPPKGPAPIGTTTGSPENVDFVGITSTLDFNGRVFLRSGEKNTSVDAYATNYVFDDISHNFNGISSSFVLKSNNQNITGFANNNGSLLINEVFQSPSDLEGVYKTFGSYTLAESGGITSVRFLGASTPQSYDVNAASIPVGGVIVSIGYSQGFGLQSPVSAGGTAVVSVAGTIQSISIGNSGSGYRSGLQVVNVGIYVSTTGITSIRNVGIASIVNGNVVSVAITNPGTGYTSSNPPVVKFDAPLPYTNLPLQYVSSGVGTGARANITVGLGLSVIDVELSNKGFGYKKGDVLTINVGGSTGIPTTGSSYSEFKILVDEVYNQKFSGWTFGELQIIDSIENLFNGLRRSFPIRIDKTLRSIRARTGSPIDIKSTLLIFINGILQIPGQGYTFNGSSFITFTEAPKPESTCLILFYRGTAAADVVDVDVIPVIEPGDKVTLNDDFGLQQNERLVTSVNSSDSVGTIPYNGPNVSDDETYLRPVKLCRQTEDLFISQKEVNKDREIYEPLIEPSTNVIKTIGITSTIFFVENVRTFFDDQRENTLLSYRNKLSIISQDTVRAAVATATVSVAGTISGVTILDGGVGYTTIPVVSFTNPLGLTTTSRAYATATVTNGSISSVTITSPGTGYTFTNPPSVLISSPTSPVEKVTSTLLEGDFGIITGVSTTTVGVASTGLIFNLFIPPESALRNSSIAGAAITVSGIQTGYYFVANNTFIGSGVTSLDNNGGIISIGSSYLDNVYRVANVSIGQSFVTGIGTTTIARVTVSVVNNNVTGLGFTGIYGTYSWGRITISGRKTTNEFSIYNNGLTGISTSPIVKRINSLKYKDYT